MDVPPQHNPADVAFQRIIFSKDPPELVSSDSMYTRTINGRKTSSVFKRKGKKEKLSSGSVSSESSACSNHCSYATSSFQNVKPLRNPKRFRVGFTKDRRRLCPKDVDALGLPLGMSVAAVLSQVLERKGATRENMSVDYLSGVCGLAVRESLANVFGDKFDIFVTNFEKSFHSTLMTLRLLRESCQNLEEMPQQARFRGSSSVLGTPFSFDRIEDSVFPSGEDRPESSPIITKNKGLRHTLDQIGENRMTGFMNQQLVSQDEEIKEQLSSYAIFTSANSATNQSSKLSTIEKSVIEHTRSNDLKTFEIGLIMKKLQLKERQLSLSSDLNFLERWKLSMGFSKASFKEEKFKTQIRDGKQVELLRTCLDFLVSGLIIMLCSLAYGTYVFSYRKIIEITEACSPPTESTSWFIPKSFSTFKSGLQLLRCQVEVFSRMLFGVLMIGAIALLLVQRSSASHQTMPITFVLILLGVVCGYAGKFCIHTLGGSGYHWLVYWEAFCLLHFVASLFPSYLYVILNGPITVTTRAQWGALCPYWLRKSLFYCTLLMLPLVCGLVPFASFWDWIDHFSSLNHGFEDDCLLKCKISGFI